MDKVTLFRLLSADEAAVNHPEMGRVGASVLGGDLGEALIRGWWMLQCSGLHKTIESTLMSRKPYMSVTLNPPGTQLPHYPSTSVAEVTERPLLSFILVWRRQQDMPGHWGLGGTQPSRLGPVLTRMKIRNSLGMGWGLRYNKPGIRWTSQITHMKQFNHTFPT